MCGQGRQVVKKQFQAWTMNPRAHGTAIRTISDSHNATNWPMYRHMVHWPWYMHVYSTQQFQLREVRSLSFMQTYQYLVKLHTWLVINSWLCICICHSNFPEGYPCYIPIFNPISHHKHIYIYTAIYSYIFPISRLYFCMCQMCPCILGFPIPPKTKTIKTLHFIAIYKGFSWIFGLAMFSSHCSAMPSVPKTSAKRLESPPVTRSSLAPPAARRTSPGRPGKRPTGCWCSGHHRPGDDGAAGLLSNQFFGWGFRWVMSDDEWNLEIWGIGWVYK